MRYMQKYWTGAAGRALLALLFSLLLLSKLTQWLELQQPPCDLRMEVMLQGWQRKRGIAGSTTILWSFHTIPRLQLPMIFYF